MYKLDLGQWSKKYGDCCLKCETTEKPHFAKGLCNNCYQTEMIRTTEKNKQYRKEYQEKNKDKKSQSDKKYRKEHPYRMWALDTLGGHKRKGFIVNIPVDELEEIAKQATHCPICGCNLQWKPRKACPNSPSLDRKNNGNIISKDTIWIICYKCNTTKWNRTWNEFLDYCELVTNKFRKQK